MLLRRTQFEKLRARALKAELSKAVKMIVRQKTAGCSPRSRAVLSTMASSLWVNDIAKRRVRLRLGRRNRHRRLGAGALAVRRLLVECKGFEEELLLLGGGKLQEVGRLAQGSERRVLESRQDDRAAENRRLLATSLSRLLNHRELVVGER